MAYQLLNDKNEIQHTEATLLKLQKWCVKNMIANSGWVGESARTKRPMYFRNDGSQSVPIKAFKGIGWYVQKI
jgi:hypothetical protein